MPLEGPTDVSTRATSAEGGSGGEGAGRGAADAGEAAACAAELDAGGPVVPDPNVDKPFRGLTTRPAPPGRLRRPKTLRITRFCLGTSMRIPVPQEMRAVPIWVAVFVSRMVFLRNVVRSRLWGPMP